MSNYPIIEVDGQIYGAAQIRTMRKERDALREDKARLDWLEKKKGDVQHSNGQAIAGHPGMTRPRADTLRRAIDLAMQREPVKRDTDGLCPRDDSPCASAGAGTRCCGDGRGF